MVSHMVPRKCKPPAGTDAPSISMPPLNFPKKAHEKALLEEQELTASPMEADVDIDLREVYFLIMHFLSAGPCRRTIGHFWNELLEHQLLPRRYHAWYSRSGLCSGDEDDNGLSFPLSYNNLMERYPHVEKDHLVKLLKQLILSNAPPLHGMVGGNAPNAADVPTLLGSGSFSLLDSDKNKEDKKATQIPGCLRWPHMQADQVRGLSLREIGGGFTKHHRAPSIRAACYAIAKPSTMVQKMQIIKKLRGHQNAVYCAIFDRSGRYVITGSDDRLVKIWSMETAFCLSGCRGHEGDITDLAVSSNNALVASASNDCSIRVWRLPDGLPISVLRGHTAAVTAIAFSPRPSAVYQLLSSSDDGTCRIWDARYSQFSPRIYIPKPSDDAAGKSNDHPPSTSQQGHQILCCAYNANGTVFVTGSSDTYARVWNAVKCNPEDSEQPNHEMDVLSGHENDVNYVQFSGCAVASRSSTMDTSKEENFPKFKNSWFTHDNIVTCSRDGSAIIWIPRSRRSHGKVGRWTRAYHLKVPPPPMPPQPPRGGPRQRFQPTPRGVNMIVWSLDNRFVLAAIMDCRICVWNAVDGSLVHSLTGHSESTYVLDVHPFNPRIAMSAGYDGKTIVWDIWEGAPVRTYETGRFKLVDGKFSPDGTSIVLSDEVGQIYILASGQGESQKDAKYDQFFLGDYRPLVQDTHGNVLDQETQLVPHRRNIQDLLCDSSMIPYPEPYQSMYQQRRLGALGIEWRPPSVKFAVGPGEHFGLQDYPMLPIPDLDRWIEPLPEFLDAMDWEQENEVQSDGSDSEYNVPEEYSSEGEHISLSAGSSGDPECSAEDSEADHVNKDGLRRSRRRKHKAEVEVTTSSGRRVKRKNLDQRDGTLSKSNRRRKSKHGRLASKKKKSSKSKSSRPQRLAARNALNLFSQISGASTDGEEEEGSENDSSESESELPDSNIQSNESDRSTQNVRQKHQREKEESDECETAVLPPEPPVCETNTVNRRRLVLKLPVRDPKKLTPPENTKTESHGQGYVVGSLGKAPSDMTNLNQTYSSTQESWPSGDTVNAALPQNCGGINIRERGQAEIEDKPDLSVGYKDNKIRWGEVKARTSKRLRLGDILLTDAWPASNVSLDGQSPTEDEANGHLKSDDEYGMMAHSENQIHGDRPDRKAYRREEQFRPRTSEGFGDTKDKHIIPAYEHNSSLVDFSSNDPCNGNTSETTRLEDMGYGDQPGMSKYGGHDERSESADIVIDSRNAPVLSCKNNMDNIQGLEENTKPIARKLRIKSKGILKEPENLSTSKLNSVTTKEDRKFSGSDLVSRSPKQGEHDRIVGLPEEEEEEEDGNGGSLPDHRAWDVGLGKSGTPFDQDSNRLHSYSNNTSNAVCRRSKSYQARVNSEADICGMEESTSNASNHNAVMEMDFPEAVTDGARRTRSMGTKATTREQNPAIGKFKVRTGHGIVETSRNVERFSLNGHEEWNSGSRVTVGLRSARNRRENYYDGDLSPPDRRKAYHAARKPSWLMLTEHEESYRYIPQKGDEVMYVRKGHQQYLEWSHSHEAGPWRLLKGNLQSVEFCKVVSLDYSTLPGSGESCCKLTLEFVDPCSSVFGKTFKLTLPELVDFSDFLVERTRYDAAVRRNWTHRDKCQVWWRNENEEGGSWWDGRVMAVKPKSPEFPDCPWERCVIQYRSDASEPHFHSPWELHDPDGRWEHPHINEDIREKLLSSFAKLENVKNQEHFGIQKFKKVSQKSDFLNRFPVPLSLEVIKRRLENNYYRSLEAVQHDIMVMLSNLQSYFGKNAELSVKVRRLSDWMTRILSSLLGTETVL